MHETFRDTLNEVFLRRIVDCSLAVVAALWTATCALDSEGGARVGSSPDAALGGAAGTAGTGGAGAATGAVGGSSAASDGAVAGSGGLAAAGGGESDASAEVGEGGSSGESGSGGSSGATTQTLELPASVADCSSTTAPNPDTCLGVYPSELHVDVSAVNLFDAPSNAYLRFDVGNEIAGATVVSTELVLQNVNDSVQSGIVYRVANFTRPDLFVSAPPAIGVLANDLGPVTFGSVTWVLNTAPAANQPYCVALGTSTNDGIGYARLGTPTPPKLRVTYVK